MSTDVIRVACHRYSSQWSETTSADLAAGITAAYTIPANLSLDDVLGAILQATATEDQETVRNELAQLWQFSEFMVGLGENLRKRNYTGIAFMLDAAGRLKGPDGALIWSATTSTAAATALAGLAMSLVDVVAEDLGEDAPESVSAADVDAALGR
jgi:hypothetical protein